MPTYGRSPSAIQLLRDLMNGTIDPVYASLGATFAIPEVLGREAWPVIEDLHPDLPRISKRHAPNYVGYDGMTISESEAYPGLYVVETTAARRDLKRLSRDLILLSTGPHPVRYASGYWEQMPQTSIGCTSGLLANCSAPSVSTASSSTGRSGMLLGTSRAPHLPVPSMSPPGMKSQPGGTASSRSRGRSSLAVAAI